MKKVVLTFSVVILVLMMGCSKDDTNEVEQSQYAQLIVGTWELTHFNGTDVATMPTIFNRKTTITFGSRGEYSGSGVFGNGSGTYTLMGSTAKTYIEGDLVHTYEVISIASNVVEAKMIDGSGTATIRAKKVQ